MDINELNKKLHHDFPFVLKWIQKSIDCNNGNGSSAFFSRYRHPLRGWSPAYPETTGYLIPTLFDYAEYLKEDKWRDYAVKCADWLLRVQRPSGGFPSNYEDNPKLSVFNTAQILLGLLRTYEETGQAVYADACTRAYNWLLSGLEDGIWNDHNYISGYTPAYYTRVTWPMLLVCKKLNLAGEERLNEVNELFIEKINPNYSIKDWSFFADKPAFTHTIAYTIRGFLEFSELSNNTQLLKKAKVCISNLISTKSKVGKTAGTYDENWKGDFSFTCVTGLFQLAIICFRLNEITGEAKWKKKGVDFMKEGNKAIPNIDPLTDKYAIPGSLPLTGNYMRFKYPNWAAKFYLDAVLILERLETSEM
ncbi:MAG: hypothetical protein ACI85O_003451 [Saprospiraceae bacterium]|jgi:hypothetical protein